MKIGIQTWGTQGDVFPFIALAEGLAQAGHEVTLAYTSIEDKDFTSHANGFRVVKVHDRFEGTDSLIPNALARKGALGQFGYFMNHAFDPALDSMYEASKALCIENDFVIGHLICHTLTTAAEKYNCQRISVVLASNAVKSRDVSVFGSNLGRSLNCLSWKLSDYIAKKTFFKKAVQLRAKEGLPSFRSIWTEQIISRDLTLIATSPALTTQFDDWGDSIKVCGFWNTNVDGLPWKFPQSLKNFLDQGEPPVYMTFGSMGDLTVKETVELFILAALKSKRRAIIQSPLYQEYAAGSYPDIYFTGNLPHCQIFPYCSIIVHHGGAGTSHAAILSGKASIIVVHGFDQNYWGRTLRRVRVTNNVLQRRTTTPESLAREICDVVDNQLLKQNAKHLSEKLRREDGVSAAVNLIEERFCNAC